MPELWTIAATARRLGVSRERVKLMVAAGQLEAVRPAGCRRKRITEQSIQRFAGYEPQCTALTWDDLLDQI